MDYEVKNDGWRGKAFKTGDGLTIIKAGEKGRVENAIELTDEQMTALANDDCIVKPVAKPATK